MARRQLVPFRQRSRRHRPLAGIKRLDYNGNDGEDGLTGCQRHEWA
jgi:hypothetical protein